MLNIAALLSPDAFGHPITKPQLIETHISWVILTGTYVYKIKKPVNFGFLDFSTLAKRKHFCEEELRLNRHLAPDIYLNLIPISGTEESPQLGGSGNIIDYAIKMREFPQQAQLDRLLEQNELSNAKINAIAEAIAAFHLQADQADATGPYGNLEKVWTPVAENFAQLAMLDHQSAHQTLLNDLQHWSQSEFSRCESTFLQRKQTGFIRECHGDLHLRNIAWLENKPLIFDCIEFNPSLRWIDVISDIAFLVMDLFDRNQPALAMSLLNRYLEQTGDYEGIKLLPFYFVYRALMRAKVAALRLKQSHLTDDETENIQQEMLGYLQLAQDFLHRPAGQLIITWGLSGSGKTYLTAALLEPLRAIRIRSDVERKRLAGLLSTTPAQANIDKGIYSREMTDKTYHRLHALADLMLQAGFPIIVDATFHDPNQRDQFRQLAQQRRVAFVILECVASAETLRDRIAQRRGDASDADLRVLEHQLTQVNPISEQERLQSIRIDTEVPIDYPALALAVQKFPIK